MRPEYEGVFRLSAESAFGRAFTGLTIDIECVGGEHGKRRVSRYNTAGSQTSGGASRFICTGYPIPGNEKAPLCSEAL